MFEFLFCAIGALLLIPLAILGAIICGLSWGLGAVFKTVGAIVGIAFAIVFGIAIVVAFGVFGLLGGLAGLIF